MYDFTVVQLVNSVSVGRSVSGVHGWSTAEATWQQQQSKAGGFVCITFKFILK